MTTVPVPTTMSMSSDVSGLPALPMPLMRPSRMPMLATRTPSTASSTTTLVMSTSHDSRAERAFSPMPSRPVLAKPTRISSPASGTRSVIRRRSRVSPSTTTSPSSGPYSRLTSPLPSPRPTRRMAAATAPAAVAASPDGHAVHDVEVPARAQRREGTVADDGIVERTVDQPAVADHDPVAGDGPQPAARRTPPAGSTPSRPWGWPDACRTPRRGPAAGAGSPRRGGCAT